MSKLPIKKLHSTHLPYEVAVAYRIKCASTGTLPAKQTRILITRWLAGSTKGKKP